MAASAQPSGALIGRLPGVLIGIVRRRAITVSSDEPTQSAAHDEPIFLVDENNYIPTGSADLWRRGKPGR